MLRFVTILISLLFFRCINCINMTIITVTIGRNPSFGYEAIAPVYDVAFAEMKETYPHLFKNATYYNVYKEGTFTCQRGGELMGTEVASKWIWELINRHSNDFIVLFCAGCSTDVIQLSDFAREWDVPVFASVASNPGLANKNRFPTLSTFPANDDTSLPTSTRNFLELFGWRTVTLLCDISSEIPNLNAQYELSFDNVVNKLSESESAFNPLRQTFDSSTDPDLGFVLKTIREYSRVIVLFVSVYVLRNLMIVAHQLNMTNGDYVFLSLQSTSAPGFGNLSWKYCNKDDQVVFDAFQTVIMFRNPDPNWEYLTSFVEAYVNASQYSYGYIFPEGDRMNDYAVSTYEAIQAFAMVLNESQLELEDLKTSARTFARLFWNRRYTFPSRNFRLNENGIRTNAVNFLRLNVTSGQWQETWHYSSVTGNISIPNFILSNTWRGSNGPPTDRFLCGFLNQLCSKDRSHHAKTAAIACSMLGILLFGGTAYRSWRKARFKDENSASWLLDPKLLTAVESRYPCQKQYNGATVWFSSFSPAFSPEQLIHNYGALRSMLFTIRSLNHESLSRFIGIVSDARRTYFLFEDGPRGSLRQLLDNESISLDLPLQSSVIWDLLSGLSYIWSSSLSAHGSISSLVSLIDQRFGIKLCDYGSSQMSLILTKRNMSCSTEPCLLWKAPETLNNLIAPTREADVYSLGVVMAEILTRKCPLNVSLENEKNVQSCIKLLQIQSEPRINYTVIKPVGLEAIVTSCLAWQPFERPSLQTLMVLIAKQLPRQNIIDSIAQRLGSYAEDLESIVVQRTRDLLAEATKVDLLLAEIIPATVVEKLRNKEDVATETFESVTVLFSDLPQFAEIAANSSPFQVIDLLNYVYSTFDQVVDQFDVYKVETINDSYMVASGLPIRNENRHAAEIALLAISLQVTTKMMESLPCPTKSLELRVGFHSGSCAAGIVGHIMPRYCLFGDTINTASRMESHGEVTKIHTSLGSKLLLDEDINPSFLLESRGEILVKGKGMMETFWLIGIRP